MWNDINITYNHPYFKTGAEATESVYMLSPNDKFMHIWEKTEPEKIKSVLQTEVDKTAGEIKDKAKVSMSLPHMRIDREDGRIGISIIDGRHRTMAYHKLGKHFPVLIENETGGDLSKIPELKDILSAHLPTNIKDQLQGKNTGTPRMPEDDATLAYKRKWAKENEAKLKKLFIAKYGEVVGGKATEFYLKHGKNAPDHLIEMWKKDAIKNGHSVEPDKQAVAELQTDRLREQFTLLVGSEKADICAAIYLATGKPIHRDTINAIKSGSLDLDAAMSRELADLQNKDPEHGIDANRPQKGYARFVSPKKGEPAMGR